MVANSMTAAYSGLLGDSTANTRSGLRRVALRSDRILLANSTSDPPALLSPSISLSTRSCGNSQSSAHVFAACALNVRSACRNASITISLAP